MTKKTYGVWQELRVLRERSGWASADLSKASGISAPYLSQLENGDRWPNARVTKKLADALKVPMSVLERPLAEKGEAA
jgi:transcriptional regulator with XRE-family HTH domain